MSARRGKWLYVSSDSENEEDISSHKARRCKSLGKLPSDYDGDLASFNRRTARKGGLTLRLRRNTHNGRVQRHRQRPADDASSESDLDEPTPTGHAGDSEMLLDA